MGVRFFFALRGNHSTIRSPDRLIRIQGVLIRRSLMNIFDMLPPRSTFDRHPKIGKFTAVQA
jgi:hypothetical protein